MPSDLFGVVVRTGQFWHPENNAMFAHMEYYWKWPLDLDGDLKIYAEATSL